LRWELAGGSLKTFMRKADLDFDGSRTWGQMVPFLQQYWMPPIWVLLYAESGRSITSGLVEQQNTLFRSGLVIVSPASPFKQTSKSACVVVAPIIVVMNSPPCQVHDKFQLSIFIIGLSFSIVTCKNSHKRSNFRKREKKKTDQKKNSVIMKIDVLEPSSCRGKPV
jgi:hypothetical protein